MTDSTFEQPTSEQLSAFVAGDPVAKDGVVRLLLPQLCRWAFGRYSDLPRADVQSEIHQVFAEFCQQPSRYDPSKSLPTTYLINLIRLRMIDLRKRIYEIEQWEEQDYENLAEVLYNKADKVDLETTLNRRRFFDEFASSLDEVERDFLELMLRGEKRTSAFSTIIRKHGRDFSDEQKAVKGVKERLLRKLRAFAEDKNYQSKDL